jgi:hypothetical protein
MQILDAKPGWRPDPPDTGSYGPLATVAVTNGKGGLGETCVVVNPALALAREGGPVMLPDADSGMAHLDGPSGLEAPRCTTRQPGIFH